MDQRSLRRVFLVLLALAGLQIMAHAQFLPALVASNFGADGQALTWVAREVFVLREGALLASLPLLFLVFPGIVIRHWPGRLMPRGRGYWLDPARRAQTAIRFDRFMLWLGIASLGLIVALTQLVFDANRRLPPALEVQVVMRWLIAYVAFFGVWLWRVWREFRRGSSP